MTPQLQFAKSAHVILDDHSGRVLEWCTSWQGAGKMALVSELRTDSFRVERAPKIVKSSYCAFMMVELWGTDTCLGLFTCFSSLGTNASVSRFRRNV
jgi:hypothetical protein